MLHGQKYVNTFMQLLNISLCNSLHSYAFAAIQPREQKEGPALMPSDEVWLPVGVQVQASQDGKTSPRSRTACVYILLTTERVYYLLNLFNPASQKRRSLDLKHSLNGDNICTVSTLVQSYIRCYTCLDFNFAAKGRRKLYCLISHCIPFRGHIEYKVKYSS